MYQQCDRARKLQKIEYMKKKKLRETADSNLTLTITKINYVQKKTKSLK